MFGKEKLESNKDNQQDLMFSISEAGQRVLDIIEESKNKAVGNSPGNISVWDADPIPDFGDLDDLDTPCVLTINDHFNDKFDLYSFSELKFDKEMAREFLSKLVLGEELTVVGKGRAIQTYEKREGDNVVVEDSNTEYIDNEVEVTLKVLLDSEGVRLSFKSESINPKNDFSINRIIELKE